MLLLTSHVEQYGSRPHLKLEFLVMSVVWPSMFGDSRSDSVVENVCHSHPQVRYGKDPTTKSKIMGFLAAVILFEKVL